MDKHLYVDLKRFEVLDQSKLEELKILLREKNIYSSEILLILDTLRFDKCKPPSYTGKKLPKKIEFVRGRATIRIANRLINLQIRKW